MKKLLRYADCFVLLAAIVGCLLRFWVRNSDTGSAPTSHPGWILLCLLSAGIVVFLWLLSRHAGDRQTYADNYAKSIPGAATYLLLALVLAYSGITDLVYASDLLAQLTAIASMLSAISLAVAGIERFCGNQPVFFVHMVPCIFFALRLFDMGRAFGAEPELYSFLFSFLASLCLIPAYYWLWSFDVNLGNRQRSLFWSLTATFFCLLATFDVEQGWALYMLHAAVLLSNLCRLQHLPTVSEEEALPADEENPTTWDAPIPKKTYEEAVPIRTGMPTFEEVPFMEEDPIIEEMPTIEATPIVEEKPVVEEEPIIEEELPPVVPRPVYRKPVLHADIDPEEDMDAFLDDIKRFLASEDF